jgi:hypothetical protein
MLGVGFMDAITLRPKVTDLIFDGSSSMISYLERSGLTKHRKYLASKKSRKDLRYSALFFVKALVGDVEISIMHLLLSLNAKT